MRVAGPCRKLDVRSRFHGQIDELALYNAALSAARVQQHFKASGR
jgi:hypothetical protein